MADTQKILIVDDDQEICDLLVKRLVTYGFEAVAVDCGTKMLQQLATGTYALLILDIMLRGEDGLALCREVRASHSPYKRIPVIFLSALGETTDKVVGLEIGGDDYLPKPFETRELVARIKALLRRTEKVGHQSKVAGPQQPVQTSPEQESAASCALANGGSTRRRGILSIPPGWLCRSAPPNIVCWRSFWRTRSRCSPVTSWWSTSPFAAPTCTTAVSTRRSAFAVLVLVLLRKLLKPFQQLTAAADHIGKQPEFCSPLPEEGCKEIREAAQSLNRMQARIQENLAERNRMLAAMAHDLRTPLTRVQLRLEEVEPEDLRDKLTAGIKEVRSIAEQSLELSGSLKVSEKFVPLDIVAFMQSCVDDFSDMGHNVTLGSAPVGSSNALAVMARPLSLKRCVDNILRNAMAYAGNTGNIGDTGRAEVRITCSKGDVIVDICDNGPGIPEDCLGKIFEPYFRLETSRNRESGGTGLGLSIARNMILLNNGTLTLFNRPEGGLYARITLPRLERT